MQEIEMPEKCCFYPLEEELGRGALIKQKFNYLLSIRNFRRRKVHWHGQAAAGETHSDYFCAKIHTKYTLKVFDLKVARYELCSTIQEKYFSMQVRTHSTTAVVG